ncbi:hypothetical protein [Streptomyces sp. NPDC126522]|uniref:hypothetical protein n=1 Tax=Streptomyces sp. NPDC126522 TaxID=3155211 RepID=UPI00331BE69B
MPLRGREDRRVDVRDRARRIRSLGQTSTGGADRIDQKELPLYGSFTAVGTGAG